VFVALAQSSVAKKSNQPVRLRRLSRDTSAIRRPYEQQGSHISAIDVILRLSPHFVSLGDAHAELTKKEPEPSAELDKKREYIVKEIFSTEQTYVKNLEVALTVCDCYLFLSLLCKSSSWSS